MSITRPRILIVTAVALTVRAFLMNYLRALSAFADVTVVCSDDDSNLKASLPPGVEYLPLPISRKINPGRDLGALIRLIALIRQQPFDMVHSVTPKAGLLAQIAAGICRVAVRVHTFTGQVWVTRRGFSRLLLKRLDHVIARCATHVLADSGSQRDFLVHQGVVEATKIQVLGDGSISGVDTDRFRPDPECRRHVRERLGYTDSDVVALFLGRLNPDKGVLDLAQAFVRVSVEQPNLALLLVGPDEAGMATEIAKISEQNSRLLVLGHTPRPEAFMAAADVFCLPSYREGFGSVVIEAAACGLPALASGIYGLTDAVEDGVSGVLHPPGDVDAIAAALARFAGDRIWRNQLGRQARERVGSKFSAERVVRAQQEFVRGLFREVP